MSTFRSVVSEAPRKPVRTLWLQPDAFSDAWPDKSPAPVEIGLRLIGQVDVEQARAQAAAKAVAMHDESDVSGQVEAYNDTLMCIAVARGTCDPVDVTEPWMLMPEENIPLALTPQAIRFVWDELERLHIERSPLAPSASDEDIASLARRLARGEVGNHAPPVAGRLRKLLAFCLAELGGPLDDEDDDGSVVIRPPSFVAASPP